MIPTNRVTEPGGSPIRYSDPTGHYITEGTGDEPPPQEDNPNYEDPVYTPPQVGPSSPPGGSAADLPTSDADDSGSAGGSSQHPSQYFPSDRQEPMLQEEMLGVRPFLNWPNSRLGLRLAAWGNADRCELMGDITACFGAERGFLRGGTTYGNVYVTEDPKLSKSEDILAHESRHATTDAPIPGYEILAPLSDLMTENLEPATSDRWVSPFEDLAVRQESGYPENAHQHFMDDVVNSLYDR